MKLQGHNSQIKYANIFISYGILAETLTILFTPPFVVSCPSADHNFTLAGILRLYRHRLTLSLGGFFRL